ncbi:MAG TPA: DUF3857 domain-containing transglutaminase family protein [Prolixibacteraceae bacterium]|nr:DUF3857 domain-containing transglutaminase family protein [Prolixibacteraceae bacterium]
MQPGIKCIIFLIVFCFITEWALSKEQEKYPVGKIPAELLDNANSVVRLDETAVELLSPSKIVVKRTYAITILKESALQKSVLSIGYGKFNKISDIEAVVYNSAGERVKRIKNEDILDYSNIDNGTVYSDFRQKNIDPKYQLFPFTVEYVYTTTYNSAFFLPSWTVFNGYNTSVEKSVFTVEMPEAYALAINENKISQETNASGTPGKKTCRWSVSNFKARNPEPYSPQEDELFPWVYMAPTDFEMDGYSGNMQSWQNLGKFIYSLNKEVNNLPKERSQQIQALVKDCKNDYEKVRLIYEFAQQKNRYISVQVGIGGWQSIDAEKVDRLSYGDCKALSNYTKSLLEAAGIQATYALVGAGDQSFSIDPMFPKNSFNHMILCVPLRQDTIWLECTNSHLPCGYLGDFTDDRYVLLCEENGSHLAKTPRFGKENRINTSGVVQLDAFGNATAQFQRSYQGAWYGNYLGLKLMDETDRQSAILRLITIPSFKVTNYSIHEDKAQKPSLNLNLNLDLPHYATLMGDRIILKLNQSNVITQVPRFVRKREFEVEIKREQLENDTITYQLPEGYRVESLPPAIEITNDFGYYQCTAAMRDGNLVLIRQMELYKGTKSPERYNEFREFMEKMAAADNAKCVLVKI